MESSPLIQAHAYARSAISHAQSLNAASASEEHAHAAGEFARAAKGTGDAEVRCETSWAALPTRDPGSLTGIIGIANATASRETSSEVASDSEVTLVTSDSKCAAGRGP